MQSAPFQLQGKTVTFTANTSGSVPAPVQAKGDGTPATNVLTYIIHNTGANLAWVTCERSTDDAATNCTVPTAGTPSRCHVVFPGTSITVGGPPNSFFTGITESGTSRIMVSPGEGV